MCGRLNGMNVLTRVFDENRRFLWGVCYRMTGNAADAEDIVQETFVKALEKPPLNTEMAWRPWLLQVALNLSRNQLRRRRQREYKGPWLPSPVPTEDGEFQLADEPVALPEDSPAGRYELLESISMAFLIALEELTPAQRAVLLLRDVFDYSTNETAEALQMTQTGVKVMLHRARRVMSEYDKDRFVPGSTCSDLTRQALERFLTCLSTNNLVGLEQLLTEDIVVVTDGGGEVNAVALPMQGRQKVLQFLTRWNQANRGSVTPRFCQLNGLPALRIQRQTVKPGQSTLFTLQCEVDPAGHIQRLNYVMAPSKLTAIR